MTQSDMEGSPRRSSRRSAPKRRGPGTIGVAIGVVALVAVLGVVGFLGVRAMAGRGSNAGSQATTQVTTVTPSVVASASSSTKPAPKPVTTGSSSAATAAQTPVADPATDQAVSVLMYHHILPVPTNSIAITPAAFDGQMNYLKQHGFHPITIAQMNDFALTGKRLPAKPVLITFDDGRENQLTYGVPILKKYGFPATFFVVKKWIVTTSTSFMHAADLKTLVADGFDVQSHTTNHIQIHPSTTSSGGKETYAHFKARYWEPTNGMITYMTGDLGLPPVFALAYPGGRFNPQAEQLAGEAGYTLAFTTDSGYVTYKGQSPLALPRWNTGARGTTLSTFAYIVNSAARHATKK